MAEEKQYLRPYRPPLELAEGTTGRADPCSIRRLFTSDARKLDLQTKFAVKHTQPRPNHKQAKAGFITIITFGYLVCFLVD